MEIEKNVVSKAIVLFNALIKNFNLVQPIGELSFKDIVRMIELTENEKTNCS